MRVKASVKEAEGAQVLGEGSIQQLVWGVTVPQAEVNLSLMFVSQLTTQHAVCWHPCQQSPLTSRLKANPNFNLLKKVSLAKAALLGYSSKELHSFSVLGFAGQDTENKTEMKPAVRGLRGLKVKTKCLRGVIEAPLKFEQQ